MFSVLSTTAGWDRRRRPWGPRRHRAFAAHALLRPASFPWINPHDFTPDPARPTVSLAQMAATDPAPAPLGTHRRPSPTGVFRTALNCRCRMSLTAREHRLLKDIAGALMVTDPGLAAQFALLPTRPRSAAAAVAAAAAAMVVMIGGLPLTLASPLWGCCLSISGFICLCGATLHLTRRWYLLPRPLIGRRLNSEPPTPGQRTAGGPGT